MKAFCINSDGWEEQRKNWLGMIRKINCDGPDYGDIITVESEYYSKGDLYYNLIEWPPCDEHDGFIANQFIPFSDIDELQLVNEKELINQ